MFKWTYGLYGNDYKVATLSKSYITVIDTIMLSLKFEDNSIMSKLMKRAIRYGRTDDL